MSMPKDQTSKAELCSENFEKSVSGAINGLSKALFENCFCASVFFEEVPPISPGVIVV